MATKTYKAPSLHEVYDKLTAQLIERMESGETPWIQPWRGKGMARNLTSQKPYRGFNQLALQALGGKYESPYWLTFNQAIDMGGCVKKGEKGTPVIFWKILKRKDDASPGAPGGEQEHDDAGGEPGMQLTNKVAGRGVPLLRYYTVFNADQCENLKTKVDLHPGRNLTPPTPTEAHENAQGIMDRADLCPIKLNGSDACYVPGLDEIWMPLKSQFNRLDDFYHVAFHEMAHATGHKSRLGRLERSPDASSDMKRGSYAKEELVADMAACNLANAAGLDMGPLVERSAAYLKTWASRCRAEPELLINAAQQAQHAADWVLGLHPEQAKRRAEKESPEALQPPCVEGPAVPEYLTSGRRPFHAGDVVRYYQPGTADFATGVLTKATERNCTIAGLIDIPKGQVISLATKEQAKATELFVAFIDQPGDEPTDTAAASQITAERWKHLNLTPVKSKLSENWVCAKPSGYPVQNVVAPVTDTCLYVDEDPLFKHDKEADVYLGQLHSPEGQRDLYFAKKGNQIEAVVRHADGEQGCLRCTDAREMAPAFGIAMDRAKRVLEAQKEQDKDRAVEPSAPSM